MEDSMLQLSFDVATPEIQIALINGDWDQSGTFSILINLIDIEIKAVKESLCNQAIGPDLIIQYAITQQRLVCLQDLQKFFKTLQEKQLVTE